MKIKVNDVNITLTPEQVAQIVAEDTANKAVPLPFPQAGEWYWEYSCLGHITGACPSDSEGRVTAYRTKEEAESAYQLQLAKDRLRYAILVANDGWVPDFNRSADKYLVFLNATTLTTAIFGWTKHQPSCMYIKSKHIAEQLLSDHKSDWELVLNE